MRQVKRGMRYKCSETHWRRETNGGIEQTGMFIFLLYALVLFSPQLSCPLHSSYFHSLLFSHLSSLSSRVYARRAGVAAADSDAM